MSAISARGDKTSSPEHGLSHQNGLSHENGDKPARSRFTVSGPATDTDALLTKIGGLEVATILRAMFPEKTGFFYLGIDTGAPLSAPKITSEITNRVNAALEANKSKHGEQLHYRHLSTADTNRFIYTVTERRFALLESYDVQPVRDLRTDSPPIDHLRLTLTLKGRALINYLQSESCPALNPPDKFREATSIFMTQAAGVAADKFRGAESQGLRLLDACRAIAEEIDRRKFPTVRKRESRLRSLEQQLCGWTGSSPSSNTNGNQQANSRLTATINSLRKALSGHLKVSDSASLRQALINRLLMRNKRDVVNEVNAIRSEIRVMRAANATCSIANKKNLVQLEKSSEPHLQTKVQVLRSEYEKLVGLLDKIDSSTGSFLSKWKDHYRLIVRSRTFGAKVFELQRLIVTAPVVEVAEVVQRAEFKHLHTLFNTTPVDTREALQASLQLMAVSAKEYDWFNEELLQVLDQKLEDLGKFLHAQPAAELRASLESIGRSNSNALFLLLERFPALRDAILSGTNAAGQSTPRLDIAAKASPTPPTVGPRSIAGNNIGVPGEQIPGRGPMLASTLGIKSHLVSPLLSASSALPDADFDRYLVKLKNFIAYVTSAPCLKGLRHFSINAAARDFTPSGLEKLQALADQLVQLEPKMRQFISQKLPSATFESWLDALNSFDRFHLDSDLIGKLTELEVASDLPKTLHNRALKTVLFVLIAPRNELLSAIGGLRFKVLKSETDEPGRRYSVRVNDAWRVTFSQIEGRPCALRIEDYH